MFLTVNKFLQFLVRTYFLIRNHQDGILIFIIQNFFFSHFFHPLVQVDIHILRTTYIQDTITGSPFFFGKFHCFPA